MTTRTTLALLALALALPAARAQAQAAVTANKDVRYVRDAEEYAVLTRMVYRAAQRAVEESARRLPRATTWAVSLDLDETVLDNSVYQLDRAAYGLPFDTASWNAWTYRREAGVVPGVVEFIAAVRRLGGHVAWITNRGEMSRAATRENLARFGLWHDDDRLCLMTADAAYTKAVRRDEAARGTGACAWGGQPMRLLAFLGDALGDFPGAGEPEPWADNDSLFGARYFMLPNPMYGTWERRVTRVR